MPRAASLSHAARDGSYYAVRVGQQAGIYRTWDECKANAQFYPGAVFKKFNSLPEAQTFAGPQASILDNSQSARNADKSVRINARRKAGDGKVGRVGRVNLVSESVMHPQTLPSLAGETADKIIMHNISEPLPGPLQTNQRAEPMAALRTIEAVSKGGAGKTLVIYTDSTYSINYDIPVPHLLRIP